MKSYSKTLAKASFKELLRDPLTTGLSMIFPMCFILMFLAMPDLSQLDGKISALAFGLPAVLVFSVLTLGLSGTATPMAQLRHDGVLRSIGMTPVTKSQYLWAQIPARLVVIGVEFCFILVIALVAGELALTSPLLLVWALILCALTALSLGLLIGSRTDSPALAGALSGMLAPALAFLCGLFLPLRMMPTAVEYVALGLPYTYVGDMLRHTMVGTPLQYSVVQGSMVCIGWAIAMGALAWLGFRWDAKR